MVPLPVQNPWHWDVLLDGRMRLTIWSREGRRAELVMTRAEADRFCQELIAASKLARYLGSLPLTEAANVAEELTRG